jgi:hypothetical protein
MRLCCVKVRSKKIWRLVLGLLVALVYSMGHIGADARTHDALAKDTPGQQRFFNASILNFLNLK